MRQSLNGRANRCVNNARTVEWAGSAVSVLPAFLLIRAPLAPLHQGLDFKTSLRLALWSEPQVNAILLPYRTVLYSA